MTALIIRLFFFIATLFTLNDIFYPFLVIFRPPANCPEETACRAVTF